VKNQQDKIIIICGPTAVGKTDLSLQIAEKFSCEIISVDSMLVYRHMDIGTAKPTREERSRVPHYLIDIVNPDEPYALGRFVTDADAAIQEIYLHKKNPLLVGGTGLYFKGLLEGVFAEDDALPEDTEDNPKTERIRQKLKDRLRDEGNETMHRELAEIDPESAQRIHPNDSQRLLRGLEIFYLTGIPWSQHLENQHRGFKRYQAMKIGLSRPRPELYECIDKRVEIMIEQGLLDEVKKLLALGYDKELKAMQAIGYRHMINYLEGSWTWEQTLELLARDTRHYAKRQFTWFNNDPEISWYDVHQKETILQDIERFLSRKISLPGH
jgi:tRNA dimethylallyltransferase